MHQSSLDTCTAFIQKYLDRSIPQKILEIGATDANGGNYESLFKGPFWKFTGADLEISPQSSITLGDPEVWTIPHELVAAFDVVVSGSTLEHTKRPWNFFRQLCVFCKPGGFIFLNAPNTWAFHEHPVDCWRIWPDGLRALFEDNNIEELRIWADGSDTNGIGRKR